MFIVVKRFRGLIACLGILAALMGGLQQCHAFCYLTSCSKSNERDQVCNKCTCTQCGCHRDAVKTAGSQDEQTLSQERKLPCQSGCWCCRPAEPLRISNDSTEAAKELVATNGLVSLIAADHVLSQIDLAAVCLGSPSTSESLSAVEFCVQLCRFRI